MYLANFPRRMKGELGTLLFGAFFWQFYFIYLFFNKLFIYFWLHWVFVAVRGLLIAVASLVEHGL